MCVEGRIFKAGSTGHKEAFRLFVQSIFSSAPKEITNICHFDRSNSDNFCSLIPYLENRARDGKEGATRRAGSGQEAGAEAALASLLPTETQALPVPYERSCRSCRLDW